MTIGFIGLGNMGQPMAVNLVKAGFPLVAHDQRRESAEQLLALGANWADSPSEAARRSDVLMTSLPGPAQVEQVMLGEQGVMSGLRPGTTWIDLTTSSAVVTRRIAATLRERGVATLDAPVTGAVDGARNGTLTVFVGGDADVFEKQRTVFDAIAAQVFHVGPLGAGSVAKLLTNLLWFINAVAIGEGLVLGAKAGIDLRMLWSIIKSSVGNSWVAEHDVPSIFAGHYDPSFSLDLCVKDLTLIHETAELLEVPLELGGVVAQVFRRAQARYGGEQGELHVVRLLEDATGVSLRADVSDLLQR